jgi:hypothetical protein
MCAYVCVWRSLCVPALQGCGYLLPALSLPSHGCTPWVPPPGPGHCCFSPSSLSYSCHPCSPRNWQIKATKFLIAMFITNRMQRARLPISKKKTECVATGCHLIRLYLGVSRAKCGTFICGLPLPLHRCAALLRVKNSRAALQ